MTWLLLALCISHFILPNMFVEYSMLDERQRELPKYSLASHLAPGDSREQAESSQLL